MFIEGRGLKLSRLVELRLSEGEGFERIEGRGGGFRQRLVKFLNRVE